jgi:hypothetical protein
MAKFAGIFFNGLAKLGPKSGFLVQSFFADNSFHVSPPLLWRGAIPLASAKSIGQSDRCCQLEIKKTGKGDHAEDDSPGSSPDALSADASWFATPSSQ